MTRLRHLPRAPFRYRLRAWLREVSGGPVLIPDDGDPLGAGEAADIGDIEYGLANGKPGREPRYDLHRREDW